MRRSFCFHTFHIFVMCFMHLFFTLFVALVRQCSATPTHSVCLSSKLVSQSHGTPWRKSWQGWLLKQQSWWVIFTLAKIHWKMRALPGILLAALATLASSVQPLFMFILLSLSSSWSSLRGFITSPARAKTPHDCRSSSQVPVIIPNRPKRGGQVGGRLNPGWPVSPRGSLNHWARDKNEDTWRLSSWQHYRQLFLNEYSTWQKEWQNIWKLGFCTYALNDSNLMMKNSFMTQ